VQASALNQCDVQYSKQEQYITIHLMPELIADWKREGYTHIHIGDVRRIQSY
jgi:hypothetical protein